MRACFIAVAIAAWLGRREALLAQVSARGLRPRGDVLEIYHVDNRYTAREEEFLTELQVALEP